MGKWEKDIKDFLTCALNFYEQDVKTASKLEVE